MKNVLIVISVVIVLLVVVLGAGKVWSHARAISDRAREAVNHASPDAHEAARITVLLRDLDGQIGVYHDKLADVADRAAAAEENATRIEREIRTQKDVLERAKGLLDQGQDRYEIGGRSYTHEQVSADAMARVRRGEQLVQQLAFQRKLTDQLRQAEAEGARNLAKAKETRDEKVVELEGLKARLENARLLEQVNDLTAGLRDSPLGPHTELGKSLDNFRQRVRSLERRVAQSSVDLRDGAIVDWTGNASAGQEASAAIDRFLGNLSRGPADVPNGGQQIAPVVQ